MMVGPEEQNFAGYPAGPCPSDEDIAAFVDGLLVGADRERLIAHLADCKACYQVFSGVVRFEEEAAGAGQGGQILPFPIGKRQEQGTGEGTRPSRSSPAWWQLAAAAVLLIGLGYAGYRTIFGPPPMTVAGLTAALLSRPEAAQNLYSLARHRGASASRPANRFAVECPSFMTGVLLVDLRLATHAKDPQATAEALSDIGAEVGKTADGNEIAARYQQDASAAKTSTAFVDRLGGELPRREAELDGSKLDDKALAFGKWAEACRLAAITKSPETFASQANRRFLSRVLASTEEQLSARRKRPGSGGLDLEAERKSVVLATLRRIQGEWGSGDPPPHYADLAQSFADLIDHFDP
jgi:hypothetical protein